MSRNENSKFQFNILDFKICNFFNWNFKCYIN